MASAAPTGRRAAVYNLTVEGEHVFFANGLLASNCDALRYLCVGVEYLYPEESATPLNAGYLAKMRMTGPRQRPGVVDPDDEDEYGDINEEDWIVDQIRLAANGS